MNTLCGRLGVDTPTEWWNSGAGIRLIGHVLEYFSLGLVVGFAVKSKIVGLIVCMAISIIDQTVKIFIPARHFDWGDISRTSFSNYPDRFLELCGQDS